MDTDVAISHSVDGRFGGRPMSMLPAFVLFTDVAFLAYWSIVFFGLLPAEYLFSDYGNPMVSDWNYSFLPLDMLISLTGLVALYLRRRGAPSWRALCVVSLTLTFCSGLQAIAFWAFRREFDFAWWSVNLFLMAYPLFFLRGLLDPQPDRARPSSERAPG